MSLSFEIAKEYATRIAELEAELAKKDDLYREILTGWKEENAKLKEKIQSVDDLMEAAAIKHLGRTKDANGTEWVKVPAWFLEALEGWEDGSN